MEKTNLVDLAEELRSVSNDLNLLTIVVTEGINGDHLTTQAVGDHLYSACKHIDRIADDMRNI